MPRDPVCEMDVDERTAAGHSVYEGTMYYFCSSSCREAFEQDPERFLPKTTDLLGRPIHPERS